MGGNLFVLRGDLTQLPVTTALLSGVKTPLRLIAQRARELTDAEEAIVLVPAKPDMDGNVDDLIVVTAIGVHADEVMGAQAPVAGSTTGEVFTTGKPVITEFFRYPIAGFIDVGQRPAIVMPLRSGGTTLGVIAVARHHSQPGFPATYLDLVSDFAGHAAIALTLATARSQERENTVLADRERITLDLHDHVIQKLFAARDGVAGHHRPFALTGGRRAFAPNRRRPARHGPGHPRHHLHPANHPGHQRFSRRGSRPGQRVDRSIRHPDHGAADRAAQHRRQRFGRTGRGGHQRGGQQLRPSLRSPQPHRSDCRCRRVRHRHRRRRRRHPCRYAAPQRVANMVERARRMGGGCEIGGADGGGTRIRWTAPLVRA